MLNLALVLLVLSALISLATGVKYFRRDAFMPYQAKVSGREWTDLDPGLQAIVLAMLKVVGGGFAGFGVATLWLCYALHQGAAWAPWAILTSSAALLGPALTACVGLRAFRPDSNPPVNLVLASAAIVVVGVTLALMG